MRVCDNCLGQKGTLTQIDQRMLMGSVYIAELCAPCLGALKLLNWHVLDERMGLRESPGIGHQE